jgi:hypothetical protein
MVEELVYGWIVTVDVPGAKASQIYNVAIREERRAIEAVKRNNSLAPCACGLAT